MGLYPILTCSFGCLITSLWVGKDGVSLLPSEGLHRSIVFLCLIKNVTVKPPEPISRDPLYPCRILFFFFFFAGFIVSMIKVCGRFWSIFLDRLSLNMRVSLSGVFLCEISIQ